MEFAISGEVLSPVLLASLGFVVGIVGGFFGVGGSFLAGPALYALGLPMNMVVGTDLAHITGKSVVAAENHRALGHVDVKLGLFMLLGTLPGVELGARAIEVLEEKGHVELVVGLAFVAVLTGIAVFMLWESRQALGGREPSRGEDDVAPGLRRLAPWVRRIPLGPRVRFPLSGIEASLGVVVLLSLVAGLVSGFVGGGAGFIRMPMLVYLLGVPTHIAVGTDLFEIVFSAGFGTFTHALKGNVDILIALVMHTGAAIGARIGAVATDRFSGPRIRLAFVPLPLLGVAAVVWKLFIAEGAP